MTFKQKDGSKTWFNFQMDHQSKSSVTYFENLKKSLQNRRGHF